jgi:hypothetical protein
MLVGRIPVDVGIAGVVGSGATLSVSAGMSLENHKAIAIRATPISPENILVAVDNLGSTTSFAVIPPPNTPTRRATQPAIARTTDGVIIFSPKINELSILI